MSANLITLPDYSNLPPMSAKSLAALPAAYEAAKIALAQCEKLDECKDWADKAAALASYAKQAADDTLLNFAKRIQARAIQRCGEFLRMIEVAKFHGNQYTEVRDGAVPHLSRTQAADDAGLSERQRKTALRVAALPTEVFDAAVESDSPPTITALADLGKTRKPKVIPVSSEALWLCGRLRDFERDGLLSKSPQAVLSTMVPTMLSECLRLAPLVAAWLMEIARHD